MNQSVRLPWFPVRKGFSASTLTWLTLKGEQKSKFWQTSGDFPLNPNKQKCEICFPTTTELIPCKRVRGSCWIPILSKSLPRIDPKRQPKRRCQAQEPERENTGPRKRTFEDINMRSKIKQTKKQTTNTCNYKQNNVTPKRKGTSGVRDHAELPAASPRAVPGEDGHRRGVAVLT